MDVYLLIRYINSYGEAVLTGEYIRESAAMIADNEKLVHYAEKYGVVHPCIYDVILDKNPFAETKKLCRQV